MKRLFVDTSAWYAYANTGDTEHAPVSAVLERWHGRLVTTNFVFDESLTLVRYRLGFKAAEALGKAFRGGRTAEIIRISPEDEEAAWNIFLDHKDKEYSYTDCTSFALMRRLGLTTAASTDRDFKQAGFQVEP